MEAMTDSGSGKAPWPFEKLHVALHNAAQDTTPASPAVLLVMGSLGPAHVGSVRMIHQAKQRLSRAGYEVLGGWLSPASDQSTMQKLSRTMSDMGRAMVQKSQVNLSAAFRLRAAELACEGDDIACASSWEVTQAGRATTCLEVVAALRSALNAEFASTSWVSMVRIFVVCNTEEVKIYQRVTAGEKQGVVIVPSPGEEEVLEKPTMLVYVAEPPSDTLTLTSDWKLRAAWTAGDTAFLVNATTRGEARFLLEPSEEERAEFSEDFDKLQQERMPEGHWPFGKLMQRLAQLPDSRYPAVLVASGAFSPAHKGHVMMLREARDRLERAGYAVLGGWLSPASVAAAEGEAKEKGVPLLSAAFRQKVAELSVCDDDFVSVGSWELERQDGATKPHDLCRELQRYLSERFSASFDGQIVRVFYVCGTDVAEKCNLYAGIVPAKELGVVVVPRGDDDARLETPSQLVFVSDAIHGDEAHFSSSRVRSAIRENSVATASQELAPAAARYVLAPTPAERVHMSADFDALGGQSLEPADLQQAKSQLKDTLREWAGPQGSIHTDDLARLLTFIDPSWTQKEMTALMTGASVSPDGFVSPEEFIDWLFSRCQA